MMNAATGRVILICNDVDAGRALGRACRERGLEPPGWCVPLSGDGWPGYEALIIVEEAGEYPARLLVEGAGGRPVILVGEGDDQGDPALQVIRPEPGYEAIVAERLVDLLGLSVALLPTYENRLRVLGRELDRRGVGWDSIRQTPGGLRVRPAGQEQQDATPFELGNDEFPRRVRESRAARGERPWERPGARLGQGGHERTLRAIGRDLDRRGAIQVQMAALASTIVVSGLQSSSPYDPAEAFQEMFGEVELGDLLFRAGYSRRPSEGLRARLGRLLGRRT